MNNLFPENSYMGKCSCGKVFIATKGAIHCHNCLYQKISELENTRTQSQWISVADEFPKAYEEVYIWPRPDYGYECFTGIYDKNYQCWIAESHNDHGSERHKVNVTHWMPLPLPPKEQGQ